MHAVRASLKAATGATHDRVESSLGLLGDTLSSDQLADALAVLHGFWRPTEPSADRCAQRDEGLAAALEWPRRRRTELQRADLVTLRVHPDAVPLHAGPQIDTPADLLGWLYVAEGSTLGGAVIARAATASGTPVPTSFTPYPEGPGPMWRAYLAVLDSWVGADELRRAAVVAAAARIFTELADWIDDTRAEGAA